jgi:hypothetical protein
MLDFVELRNLASHSDAVRQAKTLCGVAKLLQYEHEWDIQEI